MKHTLVSPDQLPIVLYDGDQLEGDGNLIPWNPEPAAIDNLDEQTARLKVRSINWPAKPAVRVMGRDVRIKTLRIQCANVPGALGLDIRPDYDSNPRRYATYGRYEDIECQGGDAGVRMINSWVHHFRHVRCQNNGIGFLFAWEFDTATRVEGQVYTSGCDVGVCVCGGGHMALRLDGLTSEGNRIGLELGDCCAGSVTGGHVERNREVDIQIKAGLGWNLRDLFTEGTPVAIDVLGGGNHTFQNVQFQPSSVNVKRLRASPEILARLNNIDCDIPELPSIFRRQAQLAEELKAAQKALADLMLMQSAQATMLGKMNQLIKLLVAKVRP
jgi:hypothetical protein